MLFLALVATIVATAGSAPQACRVDHVLEETRLDSEIYVQTYPSANPERPFRVYRKATLRPGRYRMRVQSETIDYWRDVNTDILVRLDFCLDSGFGVKNAVLEVTAYSMNLTFER